MRRLVVILVLLALASYVTWDRIESARLGRAIAAISARGEPTTEDEGYPHPSTPEQQQASSLYTQAADAAREQSETDNHRASRLDLDKAGPSELTLPEVIATYRDDSPALQSLDAATPLEFGGFGDEDRQPTGYPGLLDLGSLACLRADLAAKRGESDAAAAALVSSVRLERTVYSEIYRAEYATRVLGSVRILFRHARPSDASLAALQRAFESWPDTDHVLQDVLRQRARFLDTISEGPSGIARLATIPLHPFGVRDTLRGLASFESSIAHARLPVMERWAAADEGLRNARRAAATRPGFFSRWTGAAMVWTGFSLRQGAIELAARRTSLTAIAVERFRRAHGSALPASLDALVPAFLPRVPEDPFSGKPLRYRTEAGSYVVYSVDSDRHDDGGELYGFGSAVTKYVGPQSPRDEGIRVPLTIVRGAPGPDRHDRPAAQAPRSPARPTQR